MANTAAPILALDEGQRLLSLRPYQLFNTMQDETFTELVCLAVKLFNVPIGIIAFIEEDKVRFGLNHGLDPAIDRVSRWQTLCSVAMLHNDTTIFEDLHTQPCDLINPTLVQELNLGFYAGSALRTKLGHPIVVLCVIDHKARSFSAAGATLLEHLAQIVMRLLDVRLHMLQQPTWNQVLWASIYTRIDSSVTRLETLAALASWESKADTPAAQAYQESAREEILRAITVLREQIEGLQA